MSIKVGDNYKDFTLKNHRLEDVTLSDFVGKKNVVLLFFPFVNTGVCEKELCQTRDSLQDYQQLDSTVFGISVDSPFAQKLWNEKLNFGFDLLSDFNKEVCRAYGVLDENWLSSKFGFKGVAKRSAFVIDKNGIIQYAEVLDDPGKEPDYQKIKETLSNLK
jgi:peroxiredoxin